MTSSASRVDAESVHRPALHVAGNDADTDPAEVAVAALMDALGLDRASASLRDTPRRVAAAYREFLTPAPFNPTTFPNDGSYDELVIATDIPFTSLCEHHLLPFVGTASVGYLPGDRILGLSKLARVVELHARRPQVQERMTTQIAEWIDDLLKPRGVGVFIRAEHTCMTLRGAHARGSSTITSALLGTVRHDPRTRAEFLDLAAHRH